MQRFPSLSRHTPAQIAAAILLLAAMPACGADESNSEDLAQKLQNPVASLISLPLQNNFDFGYGPEDALRYTLNVQPVIPVSISEDWNLISRTIMPIVYAESPAPGIDDQGGLGDVVQSLFFSPKAPIEGWILGGGPVLLLPTATDDRFGQEKWGLGPTAVVLRQTGGWTYGALTNHIWSVGGDSDRGAVNATFMQPFVTYTWKTATTVGLNTETTRDWKNNEWVVPINLSVSQVLRVGGHPFSVSIGPKVYADRPGGGPDWGLRLSLTALFPK